MTTLLLRLTFVTFFLLPAQVVADDKADFTTCAKAAADVALEACARLIKSGKLTGRDLAVAYQMRGTVYREIGELKSALSDLNKSIDLDSTRAATYNERAYVYRKAREFELAIRDYSEAVRLNPQRPEAWFNRAHVYRDIGKFDLAVNDYSKTLQFKPGDMKTLGLRAESYAHQGALDKAVQDYSAIIAIDPNVAPAYNNRGLVYLSLKQCKLATSDFERALSLKGSDKDVSRKFAFNFGLARLICGDFEAAVINFDRAIQLDDAFAEAYRMRAAAHLRLGDKVRAAADYGRAAALSPLGIQYDAIESLEDGVSHTIRFDYDAALDALNVRKELDELVSSAHPAVLQLRRVALLIGNSNYSLPNVLTNPKNDVRAVSRALTELGFEVTTLYDLDKAALFSAFRKFEQFLKADPPDWAIVYFSGHGAETANGAFMLPINVLFPKEGEFLSDVTIEEDSVAVQNVLKRIQAARQMRLVIFDACRVNPVLSAYNRMLENRGDKDITASTSRATGFGFGRDAVFFAAQPRRYAFDNPGASNSPFAAALIEVLQEQQLEFMELFKKVRSRVYEQTKGLAPEGQVPDLLGGYDSKHYFNVGKRGQAAGVK